MISILDVGCGSRPRGNINMDLFQGFNEHHHFDYNPKAIENFLNGDGATLPYRDKSVDIIISNHCLEHIPTPLKAVKDWERVARRKVIISIPNNPTLEEFPAHIYSWSLISFKAFLEQVFPDVNVWPNSPIHDLNANKLLNRLIRIRLIKKPIQRLLSRFFGLQITAVCTCHPPSLKRGMK